MHINKDKIQGRIIMPGEEIIGDVFLLYPDFLERCYKNCLGKSKMAARTDYGKCAGLVSASGILQGHTEQSCNLHSWPGLPGVLGFGDSHQHSPDELF